jgi:hypothetical protein
MNGPGALANGPGAGREAAPPRGADTGRKAAPARPATHEEIARYAYRLFEERGRVHGHALDDWLAAERVMTREANDEDG